MSAGAGRGVQGFTLIARGRSRRRFAGPRFQAAPSDLDDIDNSFIDFRIAVHNDFVAFANKFGYLGKQLYVAYLFGESIAASLVFNGTDILRGEDLLKNLGDIGGDIALSALFVVIDEGTLAAPFTAPIVISRAPVDSPFGWENANGPYSQLPLRPLSPRAVLTPQTLAVEDSTGTDDSTATKKGSGATGLAPKKPAAIDPADVTSTKTTAGDESTSDAPASQGSGSTSPHRRIPAVGRHDSPGLPVAKRGLLGRHRLTSDKTASPDTTSDTTSGSAGTKKATDD